MKPEITNLQMMMAGRPMNYYQRALAIKEARLLDDYCKTLEVNKEKWLKETSEMEVKILDLQKQLEEAEGLIKKLRLHSIAPESRWVKMALGDARLTDSQLQLIKTLESK